MQCLEVSGASNC